ncbi:unnamed protein product [Gadus morhua 'NCC']
MSHPSKRGRQSVTSASSKKIADKNCIAVNSCNCSRSVPDVIDWDESHKYKMKRLRTRKERNQVRGSGAEASNIKSHHHHQHHRNHISSKDKQQSNSCGKTIAHCPQRKEARFARLFPSAQEPSVITTNRLIGHQGLFNHEVKSIDIERLLSEQRKQGRQRQTGLQENNLDAICPVPNSPPSSPCSSSEAQLANSSEGVLIARDSDVALHQEKTSVDCHSNTYGSDITPGQRSQIPGISAEKENQPPTSSQSYSLKHKSKKNKAVMSIMERETSPTRVKGNVRPELEKVNTQVKAPTAKNQTLAWKRSPDSPHQLWHNAISAVAGRLCHSLKLQLPRRRDVLAESREVLLLAIQERHGPLFQEHLLGVQRRLSFGNHTVQGPEAMPPTTKSDESFTAIQGKTFDQSCFETHKKAFGKSSRKQNHSNWKSPPQTHQDVEWMSSPSVDRVEVRNDLDEFLKPGTCSWSGLGLGPSASSPTRHYLSFSPVSQWARVDPSMPQAWDKILNRARMRDSSVMGRDEGYSMNRATAVRHESSGPPEANRDPGRHPFLRYLPGQPCGHSADPWLHPGDRAAAEIGLSSLATSTSAQYSRKEDYGHPFYHLNHRPTNPFPKPYHADMMHYLPSALLDRGPSPPPASFNSPERWCFPPMRLY